MSIRRARFEQDTADAPLAYSIAKELEGIDEAIHMVDVLIALREGLRKTSITNAKPSTETSLDYVASLGRIIMGHHNCSYHEVAAVSNEGPSSGAGRDGRAVTMRDTHAAENASREVAAGRGGRHAPSAASSTLQDTELQRAHSYWQINASDDASASNSGTSHQIRGAAAGSARILGDDSHAMLNSEADAAANMATRAQNPDTDVTFGNFQSLASGTAAVSTFSEGQVLRTLRRCCAQAELLPHKNKQLKLTHRYQVLSTLAETPIYVRYIAALARLVRLGGVTLGQVHIGRYISMGSREGLLPWLSKPTATGIALRMHAISPEHVATQAMEDMRRISIEHMRQHPPSHLRPGQLEDELDMLRRAQRGVAALVGAGKPLTTLPSDHYTAKEVLEREKVGRTPLHPGEKAIYPTKRHNRESMEHSSQWVTPIGAGPLSGMSLSEITDAVLLHTILFISKHVKMLRGRWGWRDTNQVDYLPTGFDSYLFKHRALARSMGTTPPAWTTSKLKMRREPGVPNRDGTAAMRESATRARQPQSQGSASIHSQARQTAVQSTSDDAAGRTRPPLPPIHELNARPRAASMSASVPEPLPAYYPASAIPSAHESASLPAVPSTVLTGSTDLKQRGVSISGGCRAPVLVYGMGPFVQTTHQTGASKATPHGLGYDKTGASKATPHGLGYDKTGASKATPHGLGYDKTGASKATPHGLGYDKTVNRGIRTSRTPRRLSRISIHVSDQHNDPQRWLDPAKPAPLPRRGIAAAGSIFLHHTAMETALKGLPREESNSDDSDDEYSRGPIQENPAYLAGYVPNTTPGPIPGLDWWVPLQVYRMRMYGWALVLMAVFVGGLFYGVYPYGCVQAVTAHRLAGEGVRDFRNETWSISRPSVLRDAANACGVSVSYVLPTIGGADKEQAANVVFNILRWWNSSVWFLWLIFPVALWLETKLAIPNTVPAYAVQGLEHVSRQGPPGNPRYEWYLPMVCKNSNTAACGFEVDNIGMNMFCNRFAGCMWDTDIYPSTVTSTVPLRVVSTDFYQKRASLLLHRPGQYALFCVSATAGFLIVGICGMLLLITLTLDSAVALSIRGNTNVFHDNAGSDGLPVLRNGGISITVIGTFLLLALFFLLVAPSNVLNTIMAFEDVYKERRKSLRKSGLDIPRSGWWCWDDHVTEISIFCSAHIGVLLPVLVLGAMIVMASARPDNTDVLGTSWNVIGSLCTVYLGLWISGYLCATGRSCCAATKFELTCCGYMENVGNVSNPVLRVPVLPILMTAFFAYYPIVATAFAAFYSHGRAVAIHCWAVYLLGYLLAGAAGYFYHSEIGILEAVKLATGSYFQGYYFGTAGTNTAGGANAAVAGANAAVAGANAAVAGANAAVAGGNAAVAGGNAAVAGGNAAVAGGNAAVAGGNAAAGGNVRARANTLDDLDDIGAIYVDDEEDTSRLTVKQLALSRIRYRMRCDAPDLEAYIGPVEDMVKEAREIVLGAHKIRWQGPPVDGSDVHDALMNLLMDLLHATKQLCREHMQGIFHGVGYTAPEQENLFDEWVTSRVECIEWARALAVVMADKELAGLPGGTERQRKLAASTKNMRGLATRLRVRALGMWTDDDSGKATAVVDNEWADNDEEPVTRKNEAANHLQLATASHWQRVAFVGMRWREIQGTIADTGKFWWLQSAKAREEVEFKDGLSLELPHPRIARQGWRRASILEIPSEVRDTDPHSRVIGWKEEEEGEFSGGLGRKLGGSLSTAACRPVHYVPFHVAMERMMHVLGSWSEYSST